MNKVREVNHIVNLPVKLELYLLSKITSDVIHMERAAIQFYLYVLLLNFTGKSNFVAIKEQSSEYQVVFSV